MTITFDERDVSQEARWYYEVIGRRAVTALERSCIPAHFVSDRGQALVQILEKIPQGATIGIGDSVTMEQIGVPEALAERGHEIVHPLKKTADGHNVYSPEERFELARRALLTDVFITGTNAVTLDGKLVNIDGNGNRVAGMIYGPRKVIMAAGANKIVDNVEAALRRIHDYCAPVNAKRHAEKHHYPRFLNLPCVKTGRCADCRPPGRICCYTLIIEGQRGGFESDRLAPDAERPRPDRIEVFIVGEELGI